MHEKERKYLFEIFNKMDKADGRKDKQISVEALTEWLKSLDMSKRMSMEANLGLGMKPHEIQEIVYKADKNNDGFIDQEEFIAMVIDSSESLTEHQDGTLRQYLKVVAYADRYHWCPPPMFIILITIIQFTLWILAEFGNEDSDIRCSVLIYSPRKRQEAWRFISYMFTHVSVAHILNNLFLQLFVGLPLEMSHGSRRVALVYLSSVVMGSLASSVIDNKVYLAGMYIFLGTIFSAAKIFKIMLCFRSFWRSVCFNCGSSGNTGFELEG